MENTFIKKVIESESAELNKVADSLDYAVIDQLITAIQNTKGNIFTTGCGTSAMAAKKIVHTMQVVNQKVFYLNPSDAVHGGIGAVDKEDMVIVISKGGNTGELCSFVENIKSKGAYIVYVGENENSVLGKAANLFLKIKIDKEPDAYNMLATASTLAVISVFDAIAIYLEQHSAFDQKTFLVNHPSGAVGNRLQVIMNQEK
ncbi:KpsF/GutQ family sugar-phosphate isomerase [Dubosiella newyorkensis]|uniref:KpsF/GutQ family sugar-phosphate isomerase n=1 Tax=Dubosiella newyorkensis TaxID=1862672 RepID=UPI00248B2591|nr:SIS domain-containing protein [Dubosiella newyorkensis]